MITDHPAAVSTSAAVAPPGPEPTMTTSQSVIVGSGPGGATAAEVLTAAGWSVIILEKGRNHLLDLDPPHEPLRDFANDEIALTRRHLVTKIGGARALVLAARHVAADVDDDLLDDGWDRLVGEGEHRGVDGVGVDHGAELRVGAQRG